MNEIKDQLITSPITVGIVILNYKTSDDALNLLHQLSSQSISSFFQIVVVDNNSRDGSYEKLTAWSSGVPRVTVLEAKANLGYAKGNNLGLNYLKRFSPEYVAILNCDIVISNVDLFNNLISNYKSLPDAGFLAPYELRDGNINHTCVRRIPTFTEELLNCVLPYLLVKRQKYDYRIEKNSGLRTVEICTGAFLFIGFEKFRRINFFDPETFLFLEERIATRKLSKLGLRNYLSTFDSYEHITSKSINAKYGSIAQAKIYNDSVLHYYSVHTQINGVSRIILRAFLKFKIAQMRFVKLFIS